MVRFRTRWFITRSAAFLTVCVCPSVTAEINLEWRPATAILAVGEEVRLGLYAISTTDDGRPISAIEVILAWDAPSLDFLDHVNDGPYEWSSSELPVKDIDGLNADLLDGDAYYVAFAQFGEPALPTREGLLVASFEYRALTPDVDAIVEILPAAGRFTQSAVWDAELPGVNIVGDLGAVHLSIRCSNHSECSDGVFCNGQETCDGGGICQAGADPCTDPAHPICREELAVCVECIERGDTNGDGLVDLDDIESVPRCLTGPVTAAEPPEYAPSCRCLDVDEDGDVDLRDMAGVQQRFGVSGL